MREIKFKAWLPGIRKMTYSHTLDELITWSTKPEDSRTAVWLQYIGRKDKNSNEVYEGDIVKYKSEHHTVYGIVRLGEVPDVSGNLKHLGYYIEWLNDGMNEWGKWWRNDIIFWLEERNCEVVGNVFENKELLGEDYDKC